MMNLYRVMVLAVVVGTLVGGALCGCSRFRFVIDAVPAVDDLTETEVMADKGASRRAPKVAMIDVTGLLSDARRSALLSDAENPVGRLTEALRRAAKDSDIKAVIVRVNSPGGTVTASDVMYRELVHFREDTKKPVVVLMGDVAASGGYYLACAADEIIAHPTTVTGSIGVIMQTFNVTDGLGRIGITADAITSGPNKKMGSPFEPMPVEHRELLQNIVDEFYGGFVEVVRSNRDVSESDLGWVTDGRVVTGPKALEVGLVDSVGDLHDAFAAAKTRAGLGKARLVKYHRPLHHVGSAYADAPAAATQINLLNLNLPSGLPNDSPGFYYLWDPTVWD